jgi:hypothetical protein
LDAETFALVVDRLAVLEEALLPSKVPSAIAGSMGWETNGNATRAAATPERFRKARRLMRAVLRGVMIAPPGE